MSSAAYDIKGNGIAGVPAYSHLTKSSIRAKLKGSKTSLLYKATGIGVKVDASVYKYHAAVPTEMANYRNMEALANLLRRLIDAKRPLLTRGAPAVEFNAFSAFFSIAWSEDEDCVALVCPAQDQKLLIGSSLWKPSYSVVESKTGGPIDLSMWHDLYNDGQIKGLARKATLPEIFVVNTNWNCGLPEWIKMLQDIQLFLEELGDRRGLVVLWEPSDSLKRRFSRAGLNPKSIKDAEAVITKALREHKESEFWEEDEGAGGNRYARFIRAIMSQGTRQIIVDRVSCGPFMDFVLIYRFRTDEERVKDEDRFRRIIGGSVLFKDDARYFKSVPGTGMVSMTGAVHHSAVNPPPAIIPNTTRFATEKMLRHKFDGLPVRNPAELSDCVQKLTAMIHRWPQLWMFAGVSWTMTTQYYRIASTMLAAPEAKYQSVEAMGIVLVAPKLPTLEWGAPIWARSREIVVTDELKGATTSYANLDATMRLKPPIQNVSPFQVGSTKASLRSIIGKTRTCAIFNLYWGVMQRMDDTVRYPQLEEDLIAIGKVISNEWSRAIDVPTDEFHIASVVLINIPALRMDIELKVAGTSWQAMYRDTPVDVAMMRCIQLLSDQLADLLEPAVKSNDTTDTKYAKGDEKKPKESVGSIGARIYPFQCKGEACMAIVRGSKRELPGKFDDIVRMAFERELRIQRGTNEAYNAEQAKRLAESREASLQSAIPAARRFIQSGQSSNSTTSNYALRTMTKEKAREIELGIEGILGSAKDRLTKLNANAALAALHHWMLLHSVT